MLEEMSMMFPIQPWGRACTDKISVGAGTDIVFPTSKTQVCHTHRPTKSLSAPARRSLLYYTRSTARNCLLQRRYNTKLLQRKPLITRISSLDGNEICLTSALNDRPVPGSQYIVVGGKAVRNAWHGCHSRHLEGRQQAVHGIKGC